MANNGNKEACIVKAFKGHTDPMMEILPYDGSPDGAATADFNGQICYDYTNTNWYINHTNTTTWGRLDY